MAKTKLSDFELMLGTIGLVSLLLILVGAIIMVWGEVDYGWKTAATGGIGLSFSFVIYTLTNKRKDNDKDS